MNLRIILSLEFTTLQKSGGKMLELTNEDRYADTSTFSDGVYSITLEGVTSL